MLNVIRCLIPEGGKHLSRMIRQALSGPIESTATCIDDALTFKDAISRANDQTYANSLGTVSNRAAVAFIRGGNIDKVNRILTDRYGTDKVTLIGAGDNAVVLRSANTAARDVIRVRGPRDELRVETGAPPASPHVLHVLEEIDLQWGRFNFVPFLPNNLEQVVRDGRMTKEDAVQIMDHLLWFGLQQDDPVWFWDRKDGRGEYKFNQVCLLADGTPIIVDFGAVIYVRDVPETSFHRFGIDTVFADNFSPRNSISWHHSNGTWKLTTL